MKFNDLVHMILEDAEGDMFLDALDDSPKRKLISKLINDIKDNIYRFNNRGYYRADAVKAAKKSANILYTMSKKEFLKQYIEDELSRSDLDMIDIMLMAKYGIVGTAERKEERRKQKGLGNIK